MRGFRTDHAPSWIRLLPASRVRRAISIGVACVVVAGCGYATVPTPEPTSTPQPTRTPLVAIVGTDLQPTWPHEIYLALPPGAREETYAEPFHLFQRDQAYEARPQWNHLIWVDPFVPQDMPDLLRALADGRANIAVLDPYWVTTVDRTG